MELSEWAAAYLLLFERLDNDEWREDEIDFCNRMSNDLGGEGAAWAYSEIYSYIKSQRRKHKWSGERES